MSIETSDTAATTTTRPNHLKRIVIGVIAAAVLIPACYAGVYYGFLKGPPPVFEEHFAVVDDGKLLRSSQPSRANLDWVRDNHGVSTIVIARGEPRNIKRVVGMTWWDEETAWAEENNVQIMHIDCDADDPPTDEEIAAFLALFDDPAKQPVLVHCHAGVHRTGILSSIYGMARLGWTYPEAIANLDEHGFGDYVHRRQKLVNVLTEFAEQRGMPTDLPEDLPDAPPMDG